MVQWDHQCIIWWGVDIMADRKISPPWLRSVKEEEEEGKANLDR